MSQTDFVVRKDKLATSHFRSRDEVPLVEGDVRLRIDAFALTANNITYAAFGDTMGYWQFYPLDGDEGRHWGRVPVWGFATVEQSLHPGVAVGERLYGFWPMSSHAVLRPDRLTPEGFSDGAAHRAALHAVYNRYPRCAADPFYTADSEDLQALLRPLFLTAWLIDDFVADNAFFGAGDGGQQPALLLLSSASSKTAWATAACLARRPQVEVVGLTSTARLAFCRSLGCYHRVLAYDEIDRLAADRPCVYIDFAGNAALRRAVHGRFSRLAYSCSVGGTHVDQLGGGRDLPGPRPTLFFAPAQAAKRNADWGVVEFGLRLVQAWRALRERVADPAQPWLRVRHHHGAAAVGQAWTEVLGGQGDPRLGHMLSLWPQRR